MYSRSKSISVMPAPLLHLLLMSLLMVSACAQHNQSVYIIPTDNPLLMRSSLCQTNIECLTLSEIITANNNFESDTTMWMLTGTHTIDSNRSTLHIENIQNFAIIGGVTANGTMQRDSGETKIVCMGMFAFVFRSIANLTISDITISGCGKYDVLPSYYTTSDATMVIQRSQVVAIHQVVISHGLGFGLIAEDFINITLSNSMFNDNTFNCMLKSVNGGTKPPYISLVNSHFYNNQGFEVEQYSNDLQSGLKISVTFEEFTVRLFNITLYNNYGMSLNLGTTQLFLNDLAHRLGLYSSKKRALLELEYINSSDTMVPLIRTYNAYALKLVVEPNVFTIVYIADSYFNSGGCVHISTNPQSYGDSVTYVYVTHSSFKHLFCQYGALHLNNIYTTVLENTVFSNSGDTVLMAYRSNVTLEGWCVFRENQGGVRIEEYSVLTFNHSKQIRFVDNFCLKESDCSSLIAKNSWVIIYSSSLIIFQNNTGRPSGGITLVKSTMHIRSTANVLFKGNSGTNGGAMALYRNSHLEFCIHLEKVFSYWRNTLYVPDYCVRSVVTLLFVRNHASNHGGAIYIDNSNYLDPLSNRIVRQVFFLECTCAKTLNFTFINNTADVAGDTLFGGWIETNLKVLPEDLSSISSIPVRMCICIKSEPICNITEHHVEVYPGQTFQIETVAVGQRFGTVPSLVHAKFSTTNETFQAQISEGQYIQTVNRYCTGLQYTVFSNKPRVTLVLTTENNNAANLNLITRNEGYQNGNSYPNFETMIARLKQQLSLNVQIKNCPVGFSFSNTSHKCDCEQKLIDHQVTSCDIDTLLILKPSQKWISATSNKAGVIVHDHCPFDYCQRVTKDMYLNIQYPDEQCSFNRSGILCGTCKTNFSHVLGSSRCKKCSSLWLLLIVPIFAVAGIALVIFLMLLNLTVAVGTINGLIFYANIVRANQAIFFTSNTFLSKFIAWLNLDFGFEVCLVSNLDAYVKTWLQFLFPIYIWLIVTAIIVTSRYSNTASRLCGNNAVQVLATLFLLSYAKLLRVIIVTLQPTILHHPDGYRQTVWLYDGNVAYLRGKHIPLFIAALMVLLLLSIPYTTSLFFIQWLRKYNHFRLLFWVHKFKPLFDAHTGPYKDNHGYWTGWLLTVRVILFIIFSLNVSGDASVNLLAIGIIVSSLLAYLSAVGGVYKSKLVNVVEISFLLNIIVLTLVTFFNGSTALRAFSNTSTAIAFVTFVVITLYHAYLRIVSTKKGSQLKEYITPHFKAKTEIAHKVVVMIAQPVQTQTQASRSTIELRESLLVDVEKVNP